jgi:hypothetical protein
MDCCTAHRNPSLPSSCFTSIHAAAILLYHWLKWHNYKHFKYPHKKKSTGLRFNECEGHEMGPPEHLHFSSKIWFSCYVTRIKNEPYLHQAWNTCHSIFVEVHLLWKLVEHLPKNCGTPLLWGCLAKHMVLLANSPWYLPTHWKSMVIARLQNSMGFFCLSYTQVSEVHNPVSCKSCFISEQDGS